MWQTRLVEKMPGILVPSTRRLAVDSKMLKKHCQYTLIKFKEHVFVAVFFKYTGLYYEIQTLWSMKYVWNALNMLWTASVRWPKVWYAWWDNIVLWDIIVHYLGVSSITGAPLHQQYGWSHNYGLLIEVRASCKWFGRHYNDMQRSLSSVGVTFRIAGWQIWICKTVLVRNDK